MLKSAGAAVGIWLMIVAAGFAQQTYINGPMRGISDSYFERFGIGFGGFRTGNHFFDQGSFNTTLPPFGGYDPNSGLRGGFAVGPFNFNFEASQGSSRSMVMQSPSVMVPNGGMGVFSDVIQRPFVTGLIPIIGQRRYVSPLADKIPQLQQAMSANEGSLSPQRNQKDNPQPSASSGGGGGGLLSGNANSSANRGDLSLAEIRRRQDAVATAEDAHVRALIDKAQQCVEQRKFGAARILFRQAAKQADAPTRREILTAMQEAEKLERDR